MKQLKKYQPKKKIGGWNLLLHKFWCCSGNHEMVQDSNVNTKGTQLLFTTHDAMLLDLDFFRRDQIWFAEKDDKSCATELYSLASFSPRKGENVRKGYLQGRFGAIPFIGGDRLWQK